MTSNTKASPADDYSPADPSQAYSLGCSWLSALSSCSCWTSQSSPQPQLAACCRSQLCDSSARLADDRRSHRWKRRCHGNCSSECPNYANKWPLSDEANGERPRLHGIILIEPEAWHENRPQIMLLMDGGDGPAATIYPTAILINSYPVTWALTGMNKLTWWLWQSRRWWQDSCAYVLPSNGEDTLISSVCAWRIAKEAWILLPIS